MANQSTDPLANQNQSANMSMAPGMSRPGVPDAPQQTVNRPIIAPSPIKASTTDAWTGTPAAVAGGPSVIEPPPATKSYADMSDSEQRTADLATSNADYAKKSAQSSADEIAKQKAAADLAAGKSTATNTVINNGVDVNSLYPQQAQKTPAELRQEEMDRQQARIDAVNSLYQTELAKARETGNARLGSNRAISAARGTLGSDFGEAERKSVEDINAQDEAAVNAQKQARMSEVFGVVDKNVQDALDRQTTAGKERAAALLAQQNNDRAYSLQSDQLDMQKEAAKQNAIAAGIKPIETADGSIVNAITGEVIYKGNKAPTYASGSVGEYQFYADQEKSAGRTPVSYNDYQNLDANRKEKIARASGGGSGGGGGVVADNGVVNGAVGSNTTINGKMLNATQAKAAGYAQRTIEADKTINNIGKNFTGVTDYGDYLPNALQSSDRQIYEQAKRNFVNAVLRQESGAAISSSEFNSAENQYFPKAGDAPGVVAQKAANRKTVIENLAREAGQTTHTQQAQTKTNSDPLGIL